MQYSNIRTNDEEFQKYHDLLIKDNLIVTDADPATNMIFQLYHVI